MAAAFGWTNRLIHAFLWDWKNAIISRRDSINTLLCVFIHQSHPGFNGTVYNYFRKVPEVWHGWLYS